MKVTRTCKEVASLLIAREDHALPMGERLAMQLHLKICRTCPVFERQILTMRSAMRQWRNQQRLDTPDSN
jgi:hypothetical protein